MSHTRTYEEQKGKCAIGYRLVMDQCPRADMRHISEPERSRRDLEEKLMRWDIALFLAALGLVAGAHAAEGPVYLVAAMKAVVAPQAQVMWDVGNKAIDDEGNSDPARLSAADWTRLASAAQAMKDVSIQIAAAPRVLVGPPGTRMPDEGTPGVATAAQIQRFIDADPAEFAAGARSLADVADGFLAAVKTRDGAALMQASGKLDEVCEACHAKFWYPDQPR
jgi:hypothetical protein